MADFPAIASTTAPQVDQFLSQSGTTVTLTQSNVGNVLGVWVNGIAQRKTTDWSLSGQVITFVSTLVTDDVIVAYTTSQATLNGNISIIHQEFASASGTTVTLNQTSIGGVVLVARNGVVQRETTDYTVNYTTGVITFTTTLVSEQVTVAYISGGGGVGNATTLNGFTTVTTSTANAIPLLNGSGLVPSNMISFPASNPILISLGNVVPTGLNVQQFLGAGGGATGGAGAEVNAKTPMSQAITLTKMYVQLSGTPGGTVTVTLRKNGAATTMVATLVAVATGNDTAHSVTFAAGDTFDVQVIDTNADSLAINVQLGT